MNLVFDISQLNNLRTLHEHEEQLRVESLNLLSADPNQSEMLFLVANAMNVLFGFTHDHKATSDDELTVQYFGIRLFNTAGASIKLALSGYAQQALGHLRDILEVALLLDYFRTNRAEISTWKAADTKVRKDKYGPASIRIALDKRDGNHERSRKKVYGALSEIASHASSRGFRLTMKDGDGILGPFIDEMKLQAWLQEMSLRLLPATEIFGSLFPTGAAAPLAHYRGFSVQVLDWWHRQNAPPTAGAVAPAGE